MCIGLMWWRRAQLTGGNSFSYISLVCTQKHRRWGQQQNKQTLVDHDGKVTTTTQRRGQMFSVFITATMLTITPSTLVFIWAKWVSCVFGDDLSVMPHLKRHVCNLICACESEDGLLWKHSRRTFPTQQVETHLQLYNKLLIQQATVWPLWWQLQYNILVSIILLIKRVQTVRILDDDLLAVYYMYL